MGEPHPLLLVVPPSWPEPSDDDGLAGLAAARGILLASGLGCLLWVVVIGWLRWLWLS